MKQRLLMKNVLTLTLLIASLGLFGLVTAQEATPEATPEPEVLVGYQVILAAESITGEVNPDDVRTTAAIIVQRLNELEIEWYRVQMITGQSIQVQLPPSEDVNGVLNAITEKALLEFVDFSGLRDKMMQFEGMTIETTGHQGDGQVNPLTNEPFKTVITSGDFEAVEASAAQYDPNQWVVAFKLNDEAAEIFGDYTEAHIGEPLAIVLDGRVLSLPIINDRLESEGVISGQFTQADVEQLAAQLRAGALPLTLTFVEMGTFETVILDE